MATNPELKPCPFCGGSNVIDTYISFTPALGCSNCGVVMPTPKTMTFKGNYKNELISKWNRRVSECE